MNFADKARLAAFDRADQSGSAGSAYTIRRVDATGSGPTGWRQYASCKACYRPVGEKKADYCSPACYHAHERLRGAS